MNKILIIGAIVILVLLAGFLLLPNKSNELPPQVTTETTISSSPIQTPVSAVEATNDVSVAVGQKHVAEIEASNFKFSLPEIKVKKGDTVTVKFTVKQGFHDWVLDEFNAKTAQLGAGNGAKVTFTADKTGIFEYYCSVGTHRQMGMVGKLIVI